MLCDRCDVPLDYYPCACRPQGPNVPAPAFTRDDLNLIRAMCLTANPRYPEHDMYPAWVPVYETATALLRM